MDPLQNVQNSAARLVTKETKFQHITPILKRRHLLPVYKRIEFKILLITFEVLNDLALQYVTGMSQPYLPSRTQRSATKNILVVPSTKLKGGRSFSHAGHKLWNELPDNIRDSNDLTTFESKFKTVLFRTTLISVIFLLLKFVKMQIRFGG